MRLNRYIASCGITSRRGADKLIEQGRVTVNGAAATTGPDIDETNDIVCIDGKSITPEAGNVYIMLNKPAGVISSCRDDRGRKTVVDLVDAGKRLFPVGRLDYDTEGLLILTSDGDFAYRCTHPKHEVSKRYQVTVGGALDGRALESLRKGVVIDGKKTSGAQIEVTEKRRDTVILNMTIHEGRNRQIKKMIESVGCRVMHLKRVAIGDLELNDLPSGEWRYLSGEDFVLLGIEEKKG